MHLLSHYWPCSLWPPSQQRPKCCSYSFSPVQFLSPWLRKKKAWKKIITSPLPAEICRISLVDMGPLFPVLLVSSGSCLNLNSKKPTVRKRKAYETRRIFWTWLDSWFSSGIVLNKHFSKENNYSLHFPQSHVGLDLPEPLGLRVRVISSR